VPNAVRLGAATDTLAIQTRLARAIYSDHVFSFARMLLLLALQLFAESRFLARKGPKPTQSASTDPTGSG